MTESPTYLLLLPTATKTPLPPVKIHNAQDFSLLSFLPPSSPVIPSAILAGCRGVGAHQDHKCHEGRLTLVKGTYGWLALLGPHFSWSVRLIHEAGETAEPQFII